MCLDYYRSWLGLAWLGAIQAPLNIEYKSRMLVHALTTVAARWIVTSPRFVDRIAEVSDELPPDLTVVVLGDVPPDLHRPFRALSRSGFLDGAEPVRNPGVPEPWDTATFLYTSGSTGPSKAVVIPWAHLHRGAVNCNEMFEATSEDVFYSPGPTYHLGAVTFPYQSALVNATVVVRERFSAHEWWNDVDKYRCTLAGFVGALVAYASNAKKDVGPENPLRRILMSPVIPDVDGFKRSFGVTVATAYSMTELSCPISSAGLDVTNATHRSCGRLRPGFEARIVDEHDIDVPPRRAGELIIRSDQPWTLNLGYFGMPAMTADAWRNGWFHTGDSLIRDDEGNYYFIDRLKDCIRRRGENISSFEVESAVLDHPEVSECAAVAVPAEISEDEVMVVVVRATGSNLRPRELIEWLVPRMPRFMIPRYVEFAPDLPKTPTDRIQKAVLRKQGVTDTTWDREAAGLVIPG
jgi:crotonobetaine/carnitine-CoA ligase